MNSEQPQQMLKLNFNQTHYRGESSQNCVPKNFQNLFNYNNININNGYKTIHNFKRLEQFNNLNNNISFNKISRHINPNNASDNLLNYNNNNNNNKIPININIQNININNFNIYNTIDQNNLNYSQKFYNQFKPFNINLNGKQKQNNFFNKTATNNFRKGINNYNNVNISNNSNNNNNNNKFYYDFKNHKKLKIIDLNKLKKTIEVKEEENETTTTNNNNNIENNNDNNNNNYNNFYNKNNSFKYRSSSLKTNQRKNIAKNFFEENNDSFIKEIADFLSKNNTNNNNNLNKLNEISKESNNDKILEEDENTEPDPRINFEKINRLNKSRPQTSYGQLNTRKKNLQRALQSSKYRTKNNFYNNNNINNLNDNSNNNINSNEDIKNIIRQKKDDDFF